MKDALRQYFRGWVDHPHLGRRIAIAVVSTVMMGLCVLAFERLDVGTDPFSCACIGLSNLLGIDLGHVEAVVHTVTLLIVLAVAKDMFGFGSLANMFLVGYAHDFFKWALGDLIPAAPPLLPRILLFIPFAALFLVSVAAYIVCGLGTSPYDAAPTLLHERVTHPRWPRLPFRVTRMAWDSAFALLGLAVGGSFGWMTVLCGVGLGPVIDWMARMMKGIID